MPARPALGYNSQNPVKRSLELNCRFSPLIQTTIEGIRTMATAADEIIEIARRYWETKRLPVLLSALGGQLSREAKEEISAQGSTLTAYLRNNLNDRIRFLALRAHGGGVAPVEGTETLSDEELASLVPPPVGRNLPFAKPRPPRFHPVIWQAFFEPHPEPHVYVERSANNEILIHRCSEPHSEPGWVEILPSDLPAVEEGARPFVPEVLAAIRAWAMRNEIPLSQIQSERPSVATHSAPQGRGSHDYSTLDGIFSRMTPDELRRISIPADILLNVLRRM